MSKQTIKAMAQTRSQAAGDLEQRLRILQNARADAIAARREAIDEFWGGAGKLLRGAIDRICRLSQRVWNPRRHPA